MSNTREQTEEWYRKYEEKTGRNRNNALKNPEVTFQMLAFDVSIIKALMSLEIDRPHLMNILDVGCGVGASLLNFIRLGFDPSKMHGIDIIQENIDEGRKKFPNINLICENASKISFLDDTFDIVFEQGMFIQIINDELSEQIAREMLRVTKPQGYIILIDWRYSKPGDPDYKGLHRKRIVDLFKVGKDCSIRRVYKGAIVPPIGRFISKNMPSTYFCVQSLFPFLVGQITTVLQKTSSDE